MKAIFRTTAIVASTLVSGGAWAQDAPITLHWALWDLNRTHYYLPLIEAYQAANPNVTIQPTDLGSADYETMLMTQLTGGANNLDVVTIKNMPSYAQMVNAGSLLDLADAVNPPEGAENYVDMMESQTVDGKLYGIPFRTDFWVIYYNKDLFDKAGQDYPGNDMTWDEIDALAAELTTGFGQNKTYGLHMHIWRTPIQHPSVQDGTHTAISGEYSHLAPWYERALALQDEGVIMNYGSLKASNTHYSGPFFNGQVAMMPMGSWFIGTQMQQQTTAPTASENWGIAAFAHPEGVAAGTTVSEVTSLGVNANSRHKEAATDFAAWVGGPEGAKIVAQTANFPALLTDEAIETIAGLPGFPDDEGSLEALRPTTTIIESPYHPRAADIQLMLNRGHDAIMTGSQPVADVIKDLDTQAARIMN